MGWSVSNSSSLPRRTSPALTAVRSSLHAGVALCVRSVIGAVSGVGPSGIRLQELATSWYTIAEGNIGDWFGGFLYSAGQQANEAVQDQLSALSFTWFFISSSIFYFTNVPCRWLTLLGICSLAIIFGAGLVTSLSPCSLSVLPLALGYIGLATTLALLGVGASFAGKAYGQIGQGLPLGASALAVIMGLNLLEDPVIGESLLLTYTTGYVTPLLLAASFAGALQSLASSLHGSIPVW